MSIQNKLKTIIVVISFLSSGLVFANTDKDSNVDDLKEFSNLKVRTKSLEKRVKLLKKQASAIYPSKVDSAEQENDFHTLLEMSAHGPVVVSSPTFGVRRATGDEYEYESKTITSLSTINDDLVLLHLRKKIDVYAQKHNIKAPNRPIVVLSGALEGAIHYTEDYKDTNKTDINLEGAQLDVISEIGPWITSAFIITYDDDKLDGTGTRVSNSKLSLNRAFFSIGQLNKNPFYLTVGQIYAPFGRFSSNMVTKPAVRKLGRVKDRMAILGFSKKALNFQLYSLAGETKGPNESFVDTVLGHSGFNIGNNFKIGDFKIDVEASVIGNIAEAEGFQKSVFIENKQLHSRVWGVDGRIRIKYDPFTIASEYVGATRRFDHRDMSFNGNGAQPQAFSLEGSVDFKTLACPSTFAVGYGETWQALAIKQPKKYYFIQYDVEFLRDTLFALEYRYDVNYGTQDIATGGDTPLSAVTPAGKYQNIATAKVFVWF